jgi:hypothetical protein
MGQRADAIRTRLPEPPLTTTPVGLEADGSEGPPARRADAETVTTGVAWRRLRR